MNFLVAGESVKDDKNNVYILDEIVGQGGFGCVFKAHREKDNSVFAIKTLTPSFADPSYVLSFKNEIKLAAKVTGNNIIQYEFVNDGDTVPDFPPYIIMEYAAGGTLKDMLIKRVESNELYSNKELITIFKQLSEGMRRINSELVHRDIKPENILLCGNTLKISDFGLSKVAAEKTRTKSFKGGGTLPYMAPEAFDHSKNTIQMDVYSMGIVFYELATLNYPYTNVSSNYDYEAYKEAHLYSAIKNPVLINPKLSPSLVSVINRMLEKPAKNRFANWDEIIKLLDSQEKSISPIDDLVAQAISSRNAEDIARQQRKSALEKEQKEKEDHVKLIYSQFDRTIINPIVEFAEKINSGYAGDKLTFSAKRSIDPKNTKFSWKLCIPPDNEIHINYEVIFEENFVHTEIDKIEPFLTISQTYRNIPQYKNKKILAWGEITNSFNYGFNILLLDNGDIYGDWIIMNNKNNFGGDKKEPFAFTIDDLPYEINLVQATHIFRSYFEEFNEISFLSQIKLLSFGLKS